MWRNRADRWKAPGLEWDVTNGPLALAQEGDSGGWKCSVVIFLQINLKFWIILYRLLCLICILYIISKSWVLFEDCLRNLYSKCIKRIVFFILTILNYYVYYNLAIFFNLKMFINCKKYYFEKHEKYKIHGLNKTSHIQN